MTCSNCGGELTSGTGIDYMGTHARHSSRSDCIDVKNQRIAALEAELAAERARSAEAIFAREALWQYYRRCTDALGFKWHQVPENPEKELEMWRGMQAKVTELEADRERLDWLVQNGARISKASHRMPGNQEFTCGGWYGVWIGDQRVTPKDDYPEDWREAIDAAREAANGEVKRS